MIASFPPLFYFKGRLFAFVMTRLCLVLIFLSSAALVEAAPATHGRFSHCECKGDYKPARNVVKWYTVRIRKEWEYRHHCLPCGRRIPYRVKVITYRDRYSDGTQRTWKCVVANSEVTLGPPMK
jgi:hypothetical protein